MINTHSFVPALLLTLVASTAFAAEVGSANPVEKSFRTAMEQHLATQGTVCLGKFDWPVEVSEQDFQTGSRDAVQMPVLEELGLVMSSQESVQVADAKEKITVKHYTMTDAGRRYYIEKESVTGTGATRTEHHRDLCPVRLGLDKIVRWDALKAVGDMQETTLTYTYKVTAADWTRNPAAQKVFPMIDRIVQGAGTLQLQQRLRLTKQGWVAVAPTE